MAKKSKFAKAVVALGAIGVASKIAYDKYKNVKDDFVKEETASAEDDVKKYNAIFEKKVVEVEDEEFMGCEVKAVGSKAVIDLGLAVFERDVYINFSSNASTVTIILPEGVNVTCDVEKKLSGVRNLVENSDEDGVHTVYIIGKAVCSNVEIIPVNFYIDDDDFEDIEDSEDDFEDESSDEAENKEDVPAQDSDEEASAENDSDEEAEQEDELEIKEVKED